MRKKSKQQLMLESQERRVVSKKEEARAIREAAAVRKEAKRVARRTEDVSQLADVFKGLSSSPI